MPGPWRRALQPQRRVFEPQRHASELHCRAPEPRRKASHPESRRIRNRADPRIAPKGESCKIRNSPNPESRRSVEPREED